MNVTTASRARPLSSRLGRMVAFVALFGSLSAAQPAAAGVGDLLVAPTRIVLNGSRGTEIILTNIGEDPATYRVSIEFRRMMPDGTLHEVPEPNAAEQLAQSMILYAPRKVTLAPNQPQSIRIAARAPKDLPDGEYRVHLLFRAVPPPIPAGPPKEVKGIAFELRPVYGVTIPVIVRFGNLEAKAGIADVRLVQSDGKPAVSLELTRTGGRSVFGEVRVLKSGIKDPIAVQRGVAVYTEVGERSLTIPIDERYASAASGPVTIQYVEPSDHGPLTIAETQAVLR
jgi:P pilus assembly chaperone PapD